MLDSVLVTFDNLQVNDFDGVEKPFFDTFGVDSNAATVRVVLVDISLSRDCSFIDWRKVDFPFTAFLQDVEQAINLDDLMTQRLLL